MEDADYDITAIQTLLTRAEEDLSALKIVIQKIARFEMVASRERKLHPSDDQVCITTISKITSKSKQFGQGDHRVNLDIKSIPKNMKDGTPEFVTLMSEIHHALCRAFYEIRNECHQRCEKYNTEKKSHEKLQTSSMRFRDGSFSFNCEQAWPVAIRCEVGKMKQKIQCLRAEMSIRTRQKKQQEDELKVLQVTEKNVSQELQRIESRSPLLTSKIANEEVLSGCLEKRLCSLLSQLTSSEKALIQVQALWNTASNSRNTEKHARSESKAKMEEGLKQMQSDLETSFIAHATLEENLSRTSQSIGNYEEYISELENRTHLLCREFEGMEGCQTILNQDLTQVTANEEILTKDVAERKLELQNQEARGSQLQEYLSTMIEKKRACLKNLVAASNKISRSELKSWEDELQIRKKKIEIIVQDTRDAEAATKKLDAQQRDVDSKYDKLFQQLADVERTVNAAKEAFTTKQEDYQVKLAELKTIIAIQRKIYVKQQNEKLAEESNQTHLKQSLAEQQGIARDKLRFLEHRVEEVVVQNANYENTLESLQAENDLLRREHERLTKECGRNSKMYITQSNKARRVQLDCEENILRINLACKSKVDITANVTETIIYTNEATDRENSKCDELLDSLRILEDQLACIEREKTVRLNNLSFLNKEVEKKKQMQNESRTEFQTYLSGRMVRVEHLRNKAWATMELNRDLVSKYRTIRHRLVKAHTKLQGAREETKSLRDIINNWKAVKEHQETLYMEMVKYKTTRRAYFHKKIDQLPPICEFSMSEFKQAEERLEQDIENMIRPRTRDLKAIQCDSCSGKCSNIACYCIPKQTNFEMDISLNS